MLFLIAEQKKVLPFGHAFGVDANDSGSSNTSTCRPYKDGPGAWSPPLKTHMAGRAKQFWPDLAPFKSVDEDAIRSLASSRSSAAFDHLLCRATTRTS